MSFLL